MLVGLDVQSATGQATGIGHYARELANSLSGMLPESQIRLIHQGTDDGWGVPERMKWEQYQLPLLAKNMDVDILHVPGFACPLVRNCKCVLTLHDVIGVEQPMQIPSRGSRWYWSKWVPFAARHADRIITDSVYSKQKIAELCRIDPNRIDVIPLAVSSTLTECRPDPERVQSILKKFNISKDYILSVCTLEKRKNHSMILRAYHKLPRSIREQYQIVFAGKQTGFSEINYTIDELGLHDDVILTGYTSTEDLASLYSHAGILVFASFYEGFGLPPLEGMSFGLPVVCFRSTSIPEVVGDAGMLVEPESGESGLCEAMGRLLSDADLRKDFSSRAIERASQFSWENTAAATLDSYKKLLGE